MLENAHICGVDVNEGHVLLRDSWPLRICTSLLTQVIENYGTGRPGYGSAAIDADEDGETSVKRAQAILKRLRKRDLYKFVDELLVPQDLLANDK